MTDRFDAIVVGAGHNGLPCACYLAKAGLKVLVLEQYRTPGGMTMPTLAAEFGRPEAVDGYRFEFQSAARGSTRTSSPRDEGLLCRLRPARQAIEFPRGPQETARSSAAARQRNQALLPTLSLNVESSAGGEAP